MRLFLSRLIECKTHVLNHLLSHWTQRHARECNYRLSGLTPPELSRVRSMPVPQLRRSVTESLDAGGALQPALCRAMVLVSQTGQGARAGNVARPARGTGSVVRIEEASLGRASLEDCVLLANIMTDMGDKGAAGFFWRQCAAVVASVTRVGSLSCRHRRPLGACGWGTLDWGTVH